MSQLASPTIDGLEVAAYRIPTDAPESDGTAEWNHTDVITVHAHAVNQIGFGWTYAPKAVAVVIEDILKEAVVGRTAFAIEESWQEMYTKLRNAGRPGMGMMAIAAVDVALWDLKAKLLNTSLINLFGPVRDAVAIYGSGGFTSYTNQRLAEQLSGWAQQGIQRVKMKVGRDAAADPERVRIARKAIGDKVQLFVDANGGYTRKQALYFAHVFRDESNVVWFEEPRPSDDLPGLRLLRDQGPPGMDIAAGEYGDLQSYFRHMLEAGAVDCLQADATRCGGYTGFLKVAAQCQALNLPLSAHCAPQLHAAVACAAAPLVHVEYFHDHVRIDHLIFDGVLEPRDGMLQPNRSQLGHGTELKSSAAEQYRI